nr:uncharacterized protein LOC129430815 isoform X1 [Misgurnus anguillicaudatus]XP_055044360.1 uncharacterized protein LOC129430815 isoform X1 [Misgurnus anguillicaudatus]XP_055044370.1 uncharacterized protein LOC129430815 isoform X1 [Misgurnus anguillicaudatus]XP_055044377.1 uncharacterized protein LOC129430815 isoform X1 [Misgurnus anguillicaudatus]
MKKLAQIFNERNIQMKIAELETTTGLKKMQEEFSPEQDHLISIVSNGQRGRIEEQRCSFGPRTSQQAPVYSPDPDEIYQLLVKSQSRRLDEQRMMLNSSPGMEAFTMREPKETNALKISFDQICNMVSRTHSFRRRTPPKNLRTPESPGSMKRASFSFTKPTQHCDDSFNKLPSRSTSFSPDKDRTDYECFQGEQDKLFCLVSEAQRGRIEDQRCSINPLSHSTSHIDNIQSDQHADQFFTLIADTQNQRLNDQRATLPATSSDLTGQESDQLFNIISRLQQGLRIDDQRCFAPQIQLGSPAPPRKFQSRPLSESELTRGSTSFSSVSEDHGSDHDQFFSLIHHAQQRRMDDQRCSFEPSNHSSFIPICPNNTPIGFKPSSTGNQRERNPQIILTPASPATPKKPDSRPASPILMLCDSEPLPRSASFCPVSEKERLLYDDMPMQITFQISMRLPPHESCLSPEVFLTIGQPGETIVLPLSFKPGRPVSLNVNPPKKHHSRSTSPHGSPARQERGRPSSLNAKNPGPVNPHEDYFSLIQRCHSNQLQQNNEQKREEINRQAKSEKGKNSGRKEKKRRK